MRIIVTHLLHICPQTWCQLCTHHSHFQKFDIKFTVESDIKFTVESDIKIWKFFASVHIVWTYLFIGIHTVHLLHYCLHKVHVACRTPTHDTLHLQAAPDSEDDRDLSGEAANDNFEEFDAFNSVKGVQCRGEGVQIVHTSWILCTLCIHVHTTL